MRVLRIHTNPHPAGFDVVRSRLADSDDVIAVELVDGEASATVEVLLNADDDTRERDVRRAVLEELDRAQNPDPVRELRRELEEARDRIARLEALPAIDQALRDLATHGRATPANR